MILLSLHRDSRIRTRTFASRSGIITAITRIVRTFYSRFGGFVRELLRRSFTNAAAGNAPGAKL